MRARDLIWIGGGVGGGGREAGLRKWQIAGATMSGAREVLRGGSSVH